MKLEIQELRPWDGTYDFDLEEFNRREWGWIKRFAGYLPGDVEKGFEGADQELWAVFAIIALHRAGRIQAADASDVFERFQDGGRIRLVGDPQPETEEEADDSLPPPPSSSGNGNTSGNGTSTTSETSPGSPLETGTPDLDSSGSGLPTWETTPQPS